MSFHYHHSTGSKPKTIRYKVTYTVSFLVSTQWDKHPVILIISYFWAYSVGSLSASDWDLSLLNVQLCIPQLMRGYLDIAEWREDCEGIPSLGLPCELIKRMQMPAMQTRTAGQLFTMLVLK